MRKSNIRENGLVGTLFEPQTNEKLPGIILVPGSAGGIPEEFAERLAYQGFTVLALGYFALEGLPPYLESIHLEYFQEAFRWFNTLKTVNENYVGLIGYSRGGELALLLGSLFPNLMHAIVAYVPSSVVCGGFPHPNKPAWIYKGKPITPFLSGLMNDNENLTEGEDLLLATKSGKIPFHANTEQDPYEISDLFLARNEKHELLNSAVIPVENITCPLLIITGNKDSIWPSSIYAKHVMDRLDQMNSKIKRTHICYPNAGHGLPSSYEAPIYHPVGGFWCKLGGDPEANSDACEASWHELITFLISETR